MTKSNSAQGLCVRCGKPSTHDYHTEQTKMYHRYTPPAETGHVGGPYYCCRAGFGETHDSTCPNFRANEPAETGRTREQIARDYYVASGRANSSPTRETLNRIDAEASRAKVKTAPNSHPADGGPKEIAWEPAETKAGPLMCSECGKRCPCGRHGYGFAHYPEPAAPVSYGTCDLNQAAHYLNEFATHKCENWKRIGEAAPVSPEPPRRQGHSALRKVKGQAGFQTYDPHPGESQPVSARTETDWVNAFYEAMGSDMPEDGTSAYDKWLFKRGWDAGAAQSLSAQTPPSEQLVIDLARELYDRFVMGGWEPQDAYGQIREMLRNVCVCDCHTRGFLACPYCEHKLGEPKDKQ